MKKKNLRWIVGLGLLLAGLGGCKERKKDPYDRINGEIAISEKNFPDAAFRSYIEEYLDGDENGSISDAEIEEVESLWLQEMEISDLKGIGVFNNLCWLRCADNQLTELDLSNNPKLVTVVCSNNQLTDLKVSGNKKLTSLSCSNNRLAELDVSGAPKLQELLCSGNRLTSLDLADNYRLTFLDCRDNSIESLDLSRVDGSITHYEDDGVEINWDYKGADNGPAIDRKNFPDEDFRNYVLSEIDRDKNGILSEKEMNLTWDIDLEGVIDLTGIRYFTALEELIVTDGDLAEVDLSHNRELRFLYFDNLQLSELDVSKNTALEYLICRKSALIKLTISKNKGLFALDCEGNQLVDLDISGLPELVMLDCSDNLLTDLDCSGNTKLNSIDCNDNPLERLDIHNCRPDIKLLLPEGRDVNVIAPPTVEDTRNTAMP
ncbi:MAG: leucine-rich repeat domain-containing protein [Lachnospiraceae bacterium]|nr:leucine-rich repeat domain-containing protein [Lachnospiraceae bacterium]